MTTQETDTVRAYDLDAAAWRADALRDVVAGAGWRDVEIGHQPGPKNAESWLEVSAVRA